MRNYLKSMIWILGLLLTSTAWGQLSLDQKDSIARNLKPDSNKAIVYLIRPSVLGFAIRMDISCDSQYIGTTGAEKYIYTILDSGKHVFLSRSENKAWLDLVLEPGKIYYIEQQVKMGWIYARTKLKLLDEEEGKKILAKCKLDHTNLYGQ